MQSLQSKIVIWIIRHRHLFQLKLKPEVVDENFSVDEFRRGVDRVTSKMKMPQGVKTEATDIETCSAEWIVPEKHEKSKVLFYIHGGGFISGSVQTHRTHVAKFALQSGLKSLLFDYRLAPEYPFPAALEDCLTAYQWLFKQGFSAQDIIVGGESAGGTLTLSLLLALKEQGIRQPAAAFSISPVTDLRCQADSFQTNAHKDIAPLGSGEVFCNYYIAYNDPTTELLSPLFGDYHNLPPLYICVGTHEIHYDDCVNVANKAKQQGVAVILKTWPGMVHAFPLFSPLFPEAKQALKDITDYCRNHVLADH
jgi:acetyl esterase/lipase